MYLCIYFSICSSLYRNSTVWQVSCLNRPLRLLVKICHILVLYSSLNIVKSHGFNTLSWLILKSLSKYIKCIFYWKAQTDTLFPKMTKIHSFPFLDSWLKLVLPKQNIQILMLFHVENNVTFCHKVSLKVSSFFFIILPLQTHPNITCLKFVGCEWIWHNSVDRLPNQRCDSGILSVLLKSFFLKTKMRSNQIWEMIANNAYY